MKIRLGVPDRRTLWPILYPLRNGWLTTSFEVTTLDSTSLTERLQAGALDAALLPPLIALRHTPSLLFLSGASHYTSGPGGDIFLFSRERPDLLDDQLVLTQRPDDDVAALLQSMLRNYFQVKAQIGLVALLAELTAPIASIDPLTLFSEGAGICLEGDRALDLRAKVEGAGYHANELCRAWWILTGQPFVGELLAINPAALEANPELPALLSDFWTNSLRLCHQEEKTILDAAVKHYHLPEAELAQFFSWQKYDLPAEAQRGLQTFLLHCDRQRLLPGGTPPVFIP